MKKSNRVFRARPTINISVILLSIGLLMSPLNSSANEYEEDLVLESWMTIPFENSLEESELWVEDWMTTPFESDFAEEALEIETWMTESWI